MAKHLRVMGAPYGITFADFSVLSNSRNAHLAALAAREQGAFSALHPLLFSAYFSEGRDLGDADLLVQLGRDAGMDGEFLRAALGERRYADRLAQAQEEAARLGVTGVPTFFIGDRERIIGAQPIDVFRKALKRR
jgi:predicted DsbA family dithiol-disulfide isomerase